MASKFVFGLGLFMTLLSLVAGCKWKAGDPQVKRKANIVQTGRGEADFVRAAIQSNISEIKFAELALAKSADPALRKIAEMLKTDHEQSLGKLLQLADEKRIALPDLEKISNDERALRLQDLGATFDKSWCAEMIGKHEMNFQIMELVWERSDDDDVREIVSAALPPLIAHLESLVDYQEHYGRRHEEVMAMTVSSGN